MAIVRNRESNDSPHGNSGSHSSQSSELLARRFKRAVEKEGILMELRRREYYEKPTSFRKRKKAAAQKRHQKRLLRDKPVPRDVRDSGRGE